MTSAVRQREAERASVAYQLALAQIGVETTAEAIALWQHVPATMRAQQSATWLNTAVRLIMGRRTQSVELGRAYYRLVRALMTGKTVPDPNRPEPKYVTLSKLRFEFEQLAGGAQANAPASPTTESQAPSSSVSDSAGGHENDPHADDDEQILVEEIARLEELELAAEKAAEEEIRVDLQALGPNNLERKVRVIDTSQPADEVDKLRQKAHDEAGARQASSAARIAMNGARTTTWLTQQADKRALGWVRVSTTGTPCGWCAMLISRGPVYKTQRSATVDYNDGDLYHDNCRCVAIPVFSDGWFAGSPMFDLNRRYAELWPQVTKGLGGTDALSAWRRFIRTQQAAERRTA